MASPLRTIPLLSLLTAGIIGVILFATIRYFVHEDILVFERPEDIPQTITEKMAAASLNSQEP